MNKSKCPVCGSLHTQKNGKRKGIQTFRCGDCGYQFRNSRLPTEASLWKLYQSNKQTVSELAETFGVSDSTIKRCLRNVSMKWEQPMVEGSGYVHLDATYWGHNWGVMLGLDDAAGLPLYMDFIRSETNADYANAVSSIEGRGYVIKGLVIDGRQSLFGLFSAYKIQMCQFHMVQIVHRYLTRNPKLRAERSLKTLAGGLTSAKREDFERDYGGWKDEWHDTLVRRTVLKSGKTQFTHRRLRSAMHSIDFYLPYLFTYQREDCQGMPNTNNKIEGTFTDLKKNLNNHSGMSIENRKRFITGFFLALEGNPACQQ